MSAEFRMKRFISTEFKKLVLTKPIKKITVNDITTHCQISRGTFYYHFKDKQDLVNWIYRTEIIKPVRAALIESLNHGGSSATAESNKMIFQLLYQQKEFFCQAIKLNGQNSLSETILEEARENIRLIKERHIWELGTDHSDQGDFLAFINEHIAMFNSTAVVQWIRDGMPRSPEVMARYTYLIGQYGLRASDDPSGATIDELNPKKP